METSERDCVIAGGGPAGMVLGYLLARAGLRVTVLEKHADFLRDFRGDTIHPSTLTVFGELGLRERFLDLPLRATLTVAADGRRSVLRGAAGLIPERSGTPIDVLWFDLPKPADPPPPTLGYLDRRGMVLTLDRGTRYQSGLVIRKGGFDALHDAGLGALRSTISTIAPLLAPVVDSLVDWAQIKLLTVELDHLRTWHRDGFVTIGDAAHAMSPVAGVGVNYAIQDAVALANAIVPELRAGMVRSATLARVQRRRLGPVRRMQRIQRIVHDRLARTTTGGRALPRPLHAVVRAGGPLVRRLTARLVGLGFRPEHVAPDERVSPSSAGG